MKKNALVKKQPTPKGTYMAGFGTNVVRTVPLATFAGKTAVGVRSLDTAGYSKGKKNFTLKSDIIGEQREKQISRENVPATISELKKGATRIEEIKKGRFLKKKSK
jgi:hypothetical protein